MRKSPVETVEMAGMAPRGASLRWCSKCSRSSRSCSLLRFPRRRWWSGEHGGAGVGVWVEESNPSTHQLEPGSAPSKQASKQSSGGPSHSLGLGCGGLGRLGTLLASLPNLAPSSPPPPRRWDHAAGTRRTQKQGTRPTVRPASKRGLVRLNMCPKFGRKEKETETRSRFCLGSFDTEALVRRIGSPYSFRQPNMLSLREAGQLIIPVPVPIPFEGFNPNRRL